jgi:pimeloyl-ACP methyl ester carboxylesterase
MLIIRWMSVPTFINFSFKLAQWTRSSDWFGKDPTTMEYVREAMLRIPTSEYLKIYDAIYEFDLLDLARITIPTLILNGEDESKSVFRHTKEMLKLIPNAKSGIITGAGHTSNLENSDEFNRLVSEFLTQ